MYGVRPSAINLHDYWAYLDIDECAGYGIRNRPTQWTTFKHGCDKYWDQENRIFMGNALAKACDRVQAERFLGFPLKREYFNKQYPYSVPLTLGKWTRQIGARTVADVDTSDLTLSVAGVVNDPVTFTVTVDFTDENELYLTYPSTYYANSCEAYRITPDCVTISGTTATVEVSRCRLLKPEYFVNYQSDTERPDYTDDSYFLAQVEVKREYVDQTTGVNLVWTNQSGLPCGCTGGWPYNFCGSGCFGAIGCSYVQGCNKYTQTACHVLDNQQMGKVILTPATYSNGSWTTQSFTKCGRPTGIEIQFMRAYADVYDTLDSDITRAIIAIAHNNFPGNFCKCDIQELHWSKDNEPLEPAARLSLGRSTWGLYEAEQIIREFKAKNAHGGFAGGLF